MYAAFTLCLWLVPTPPPEPPPKGIALLDAQKFGVERLVVWRLSSLAEKHSETMRGMVLANNSPDVVQRWELECKVRARCWELLKTAIDDSTARCAAWLAFPEDREPTEAEVYRAKLNALAELRTKIGDADYYAGRMPDPTCKYRPWSD